MKVLLFVSFLLGTALAQNSLWDMLETGVKKNEQRKPWEDDYDEETAEVKEEESDWIISNDIFGGAPKKENDLWVNPPVAPNNDPWINIWGGAPKNDVYEIPAEKDPWSNTWEEAPKNEDPVLFLDPWSIYEAPKNDPWAQPQPNPWEEAPKNDLWGIQEAPKDPWLNVNTWDLPEDSSVIVVPASNDNSDALWGNAVGDVDSLLSDDLLGSLFPSKDDGNEVVAEITNIKIMGKFFEKLASAVKTLESRETSGKTKDIPDPKDVALMARFIVHNANWTSVAYTSHQGSSAGRAITDMFSVSDGPMDIGTGIPYFYVSRLQAAVSDLQDFDNRCSLMMSLAETDLCKNKGWDPEDPRCAHVILTGTFIQMKNHSKEYAQAANAVFTRHPYFLNLPPSHHFFVAKLNIDSITVQDTFGGPSDVPLPDYFNVKNSQYGLTSVYPRQPRVLID